MPYRDGTGPEGKGSKTGRGLGNCIDNEGKNENNVLRRGFGLGRGLGKTLGRGRGFNRDN